LNPRIGWYRPLIDVTVILLQSIVEVAAGAVLHAFT
jgi:hypothetical protein